MPHPLSWTAWSLTVLAALTLSRNPFYIGLVLLDVLAVNAVLRLTRREAAPPFPLWKMGLLLTGSAALFNALTAHFGATVLTRLPESIPLLGGPVTLEALVFGTLNGLTLTGIFAAFQAFSLAVPVSGMLRLVPRGFQSLGVIVSIAVTFVPVTLRQWQAIREAQALRGHRGGGLRDLPPLFTPLLVSSLERSLQLSEAMTARGFSAPAAEVGERARGGMLLALGALLGGWALAALWGRSATGWGLMLTGGLLLSVLVFRRERGARHTAYRPARWSRGDKLTLLACALFLALWLLPPAQGLAYTPYPALSLPPFAARHGLATLALLTPALVLASDDAPHS